MINRGRNFNNARAPDMRYMLLGLLSLVLVLTGCRREEPAVVSNDVLLEYEGMSESDVTFTLVNGLDHPITVRGTRTLFMNLRTWPGTTNIQCSSAIDGTSESEPLSIHDGDSGFFKVEPGDRTTLIVETKLAQRFKGDVCTIRLIMWDGPQKRFEFRPH